MSTPGIFEALVAASNSMLKALEAHTEAARDHNAKIDRALETLDLMFALVKQRRHEASVVPAAPALENGSPKVAETGAVAPATITSVAAVAAPVGLATPTAPMFAPPVVAGESPLFAKTKAAMYALANAKGREAAEAVLLKFGADRLGAVKPEDLLAAQLAFVQAAA